LDLSKKTNYYFLNHGANDIPKIIFLANEPYFYKNK
jgi:hypothetical protein